MGHTQRLGFLLLQVTYLFSDHVSAKDDTLVEWANGEDVTEAVLKKISKSEIFQADHSFFLRMAYVESNFGQENTTLGQDYYGGIWQVEEPVFRMTQTNHTTLAPLHRAIQSKFQVDWAKLTLKHLIIPLYSALAVAPYFARVPEVIPQTVPTQAAYWKKYYRPLGEISKFVEDSEELRNQTKCRGKMDLCIVLDGSGSINQVDHQNYQRAKDFVASMIESFTLDYTRIGMIVFSDDPTTIFEINNRESISQLAYLARTALYPGYGTRTDKAIKHAIEMFNQSSNGDKGVPKIMTVFTDGESSGGITDAVAGIRNNNIKSVSIGIGYSLNPDELLQIALMDPRSVFTLQDFISLQDFLHTITSVACKVPQRPSLNTLYVDALLPNEKRFYHIQSPPGELTIIVSVSLGRTAGYWSHTEETPSTAIHDGTIDGITFIPPPPEAAKEGNVEEDEADVYITIQGLEENNNYTLSLSMEAEEKNIGAGIKTLANFALAVFSIFLHAGLN